MTNLIEGIKSYTSKKWSGLKKRVKKSFQYPNGMALPVIQGKFEGKRLDVLTFRYGGKKKTNIVRKGVDYHFLGFTETTITEMSAAKGLAGAAIGTVAFGVVGGLAGAAIGSRKNKAIKMTMGFMNMETDEISVVEVMVKPKDLNRVDKLPISNAGKMINVNEQQQINGFNRTIIE